MAAGMFIRHPIRETTSKYKDINYYGFNGLESMGKKLL